MIQQLQLQCDQLQEEHSEIVKQINQLRQTALEKQQELQKLQNQLKIINQESKPIRDKVANIQLIVQEIGDQTKKEELQQGLNQLEEMMIRQIIDISNGKKLKKTQNNKKISNENDQNTINLRKRTQQKQLVDLTSETSESESIEPVKMQRKKTKPNAEMMEKANCLINDIFNFN